MENRVEKLRKERGLNQEDFAKAIRVSRQTVSSIENGKYNPSLELAFTIADFLGKTIEEIFIYKRADEYDKKTCPTDYLILVNPFHKIPEDYFSGLELVEVRGYDGEVFLVEKEAARQFCKLQKAAAEIGIEILLSSAYRSIEKQRAIKEEFTKEYGEDYAERFVAAPGYSEHHTGLALDFVAEIGGKWLIENREIIERAGELQPIYDILPKYGFILRYLKGKEKITGYPAEPWHIRYVGDPEIAVQITAQGITLEEYKDYEHGRFI